MLKKIIPCCESSQTLEQFPSKVVEFPSVEILKTHLDVVLSTLTYQTLPEQTVR